MPADEQSVLPAMRGVPWWGAVLIAVAVTAVGAGIDARSTSELGGTFRFCFLVGCVAAALLVRRRALFTAAAQPPLVAFGVGIITLYTANTDESAASLKSLILQVLLPIADVFPWLAFTFLVTLALVVGRWYITREAEPDSSTPRTADSTTRRKHTRPPRTTDSAGTTTRQARRGDPDRGDPNRGDREPPSSGEQTVITPSERSRTRRTRPPGQAGESGASRTARTGQPAHAAPAHTAAGGQRRATAGQVSRAAAQSFIPGAPAAERTEAFETPPTDLT